MHIAGLQKLTVQDYPEVVSCIIFLQGCNFRCPFCHNASLLEGMPDNEIFETEIFDFLEKRKKILDGVVVTGGEPLINSDIVPFLKKIKELEYLIKVDTNGTNPDLLKELVHEKLVDYVAMDIKNSPEEYSKACGTDKFIDYITQSKNFLLHDYVDYEFRTTVVKGIHTLDSMISLAHWIAGAKRYYLQQYKNSGNVFSPSGLSEYNSETMEEILNKISPIVKTVCLR